RSFVRPVASEAVRFLKVRSSGRPQVESKHTNWPKPEDRMKNRAKDEAVAVRVLDDKYALAMVAAKQAAASIRRAIHARQHARIIAATSAAPFSVLDTLTKAPDNCLAR